MCLILFSVNDHPTYKLIVAANRDEFYDRKTAAAVYWDDHRDVLGGRDLVAKGTWMAMTKQGKIGMVTNYRDPGNINPDAPSRGKLISNYLIGDVHSEAYLKTIEPDAKVYNGFNLVIGNQDSLFYYSNYRPGIQKIESGFHGLSNHLLDTPWPKVVRGKEKLAPILLNQRIDPEDILTVMYDDARAPDKKLPETGVGLELERALSPIFIKTPNYGSRCSTVVLVDQENHASFTERRYDLKTFDHSTSSFQFTIDT